MECIINDNTVRLTAHLFLNILFVGRGVKKSNLVSKQINGFNKVKQGGNVVMELQETSGTSGGLATDKFGFGRHLLAMPANGWGKLHLAEKM